MSDKAVEAVPDELWDALVVGAGPAGCAAAIRLASEGHRVLLLDRHRFPREKVCGDGLTVEAVACLARLGVQDAVREAAHEVAGLVAYSPSKVEVEVAAPFLALRRERLDALLAERAVKAGAVFCQGEVRDMQERPDGTVVAAVAGRAEPARARFAAIATGATTRLAKALGLVAGGAPSGVGIRCYVRSPVVLDRMLTFYPACLLPGYAWVFPMGGGEYNVGCATLGSRHRAGRDLRQALTGVLAQLPLARELLERAEAITPPRGAMLRGGLAGVRRLVAGRVVAIGETIGSTLPFTGEGVAMAIRTGELAADAIGKALAAGRPALLNDYPAQVEAALRPRYMAYRAAQAAASVPWLNDFLARHSREGRVLRGLLTGVVAPAAASRRLRLLQWVFRTLARLR
ncbi:MAG TPA: geranylgeranyl reductase family protein [Planctomycetota bacterium]|nr:geranylgeranyl reductase family protein [Planctomycetota bacterium]